MKKIELHDSKIKSSDQLGNKLIINFSTMVIVDDETEEVSEEETCYATGFIVLIDFNESVENLSGEVFDGWLEISGKRMELLPTDFELHDNCILSLRTENGDFELRACGIKIEVCKSKK